MPVDDMVDYALILLTYQRGRWFLVACGCGPKGTEAACMVLSHPEAYRHLLKGTATIIMWVDSNGNGLVDPRDRIMLVECYEQSI